MYLSYILYLLVGRLLIYIGMKFPPLAESRYKFIREMFNCDLCLGVWVYTVLSAGMGEYLFTEQFYFPLISELVTGCFTAFITHVFMIGWREKFQIIVIE